MADQTDTDNAAAHLNLAANLAKCPCGCEGSPDDCTCGGNCHCGNDCLTCEPNAIARTEASTS